MSKLFLIGDTSNRLNWGCRATSRKLKELLQDVGELSYALDTSYTSDTAPFRSPKGSPNVAPPPGALNRYKGRVKAKVRQLVAPLAFHLSPRSVESSGTLIKHGRIADYEKWSDLIFQRKLFPEVADAISNSDAIFINGEGSFMENRAVGRLKMLFAYAAKSRFGKPVAIVNHSSDIRDPDFAEVARHVYPLLDDALFRERYSLDHTGPLREGKRYGFAADAAFMYQPLAQDVFRLVSARPDYYSIYPEDARSFDPTKPYICVGGSSAYRGKLTDYTAMRATYEALCKKLMRLAPVVVTASSYPDDVLLRPVARKLGLPFLGLHIPGQQAVDILGNAAAYVGGRWHPAIMALTGGTPIVSFSANSDYKSRGVLELVGLEQAPISAFDVGKAADEMTEITASYIDHGAVLRDSILGKVSALRDSCRLNVRMALP